MLDYPYYKLFDNQALKKQISSRRNKTLKKASFNRYNRENGAYEVRKWTGRGLKRFLRTVKLE